jgi:integrase
MSKSRPGSLGYQMENALKAVFHPGRSKHRDKRFSRQRETIYSIETMRNMSANVHQFGRYVKGNWPETKRLDQITPAMAQAYIDELVRRERSGCWIGRVCATLRKLDTACRKAGIFPPDAPPLLPYRAEGGPGGFHSQPRPVAYTEAQAHAIIAAIAPFDPVVARLLTLMWLTGLRVREACYLKAGDTDLEQCALSLNEVDNSNRTKGGRPRLVTVKSQHRSFLEQLKRLGESNPSGHIFRDRGSLADRARMQVRKACSTLSIPCLSTHGFRKTFAVGDYQRSIKAGTSDQHALLKTAKQLGHNRAEVTWQSYISPQHRKRKTTRKHGRRD